MFEPSVDKKGWRTLFKKKFPLWYLLYSQVHLGNSREHLIGQHVLRFLGGCGSQMFGHLEQCVLGRLCPEKIGHIYNSCHNWNNFHCLILVSFLVIFQIVNIYFTFFFNFSSFPPFLKKNLLVFLKIFYHIFFLSIEESNQIWNFMSLYWDSQFQGDFRKNNLHWQISISHIIS